VSLFYRPVLGVVFHALGQALSAVVLVICMAITKTPNGWRISSVNIEPFGENLKRALLKSLWITVFALVTTGTCPLRVIRRLSMPPLSITCNLMDAGSGPIFFDWNGRSIWLVSRANIYTGPEEKLLWPMLMNFISLSTDRYNCIKMESGYRLPRQA